MSVIFFLSSFFSKQRRDSVPIAFKFIILHFVADFMIRL